MEAYRNLAASLAEFVGQSDQPCLLLRMSDEDTLYPIKILTDMDRADDHRIFVLCAQAFRQPAQYMNEVAEAVRVQLEAVNVQRQDDGQPLLDPLPPEVLDPRQRPADRLLALVQHIGDQVPAGVPVVWGLLPTELADPLGFKELVRPVIPTDGVPPWMEQHLFVVRDQPDGSVWVDELYQRKVDDALVFQFELGPDEALDELVAMVGDTTRTDDERMGALLQLAAVDLGHQRYSDALEKYDALEQYYGATGDVKLRTLALGGSGDALRLAGKPEPALARYRQGLAVCVPAQEYGVSLNLLIQAGHLCLAAQDWQEAEGYFDLASQVAAKVVNATSYCEALEYRGVAKAGQARPREAVDDWTAAKDLAKKHAVTARFDGAIDRILQLYREARMTPEVRALEDEKRLFHAGVLQA